MFAEGPLLLPGPTAGMAILLLPIAIRFYRKACRTSSRGGLFHFWTPFSQNEKGRGNHGLAKQMMSKRSGDVSKAWRVGRTDRRNLLQHFQCQSAGVFLCLVQIADASGIH